MVIKVINLRNMGELQSSGLVRPFMKLHKIALHKLGREVAVYEVECAS